MEPVRLGYVGCGFMAQKVHLPNFSTIPECRLTALAEVREDLGRKVQSRYGIPRLYRTHQELADDPEIEAVAVSAGYALQGQMARDLLRKGKHVFMEKPMATTIAQAEEIVAAEAEGGGRLMVGYMKRYDSGNECARDAIRRFRESGALGNVVYARNHGFCGDWIAGLDVPMETSEEKMPASPTVVPDWLPERRAGSYLGYLQQYTHNINLLRWLLDAGDAVRVRSVDLDEDGYTGVVILDMNGVRATLETGSLSHYRWDEHTQVYFRHGWVQTWAPPLLLRNQPAEVEIYRAGEAQEFTRPVAKPGWTWSYKREAEFFVRAVRSGEPFRSTGADTLTDVRLFEEIYRVFLQHRGEL
ncbi:MAG TPA: Gfo/Idh/MocA family oxidoreductase [Armatimonadota bacterium]|nr:Gfo/Idh/MocA family oxidoreductase [Armatimonadota bacterium]